MKLHRVWASALHSWYHLNHSMETWVDLFWFSLIDILVFGMISSALLQSSQQAAFLVIGIIFWEIVRIGQYTVTVGLLWETWSKSFSSMFISPLSIWEYIAGQTLSGVAKSVVVTVMVSVIARLVFDFNILQIGILPLLLYFTVLMTFATAAGIFVISLIIRFGTNIQSLAWGLIFLVQPLSATFYPVSALPDFIRPVAYLSPVTYVMESARHQLTDGSVLWMYLGIAAALSLLYLALSVWVTERALHHSKNTGSFARMGT
jgi:ABC-2 type transport system permease protein